MENQGTPNSDVPNQEKINQQFQQQFGQVFSQTTFGQQQLPNATGVLVLGIISLPICLCYPLCGIPGLVLAIISLVLSGKAKTLYEANPTAYTASSYGNLKAGRVCAIIGLIINILCLLGMISIIVFAVSSASFTPPWR
jgi:M penetrans paralogue family 26